MPPVAEPSPQSRVQPEAEGWREAREFRTNLALTTFVHLVIVLGCFLVARFQARPKVEQITWLDGGLAGGPSVEMAPDPVVPEPPSEPEPEPEPLPPEPEPVPEPPPAPMESELALAKPTPVPATPKPATPATPKPATPKPATPKATPKATPVKKVTPKPSPKPANSSPKPRASPAPGKVESAAAKTSPKPAGTSGAKPTSAKTDKPGRGNTVGPGPGAGTAGSGPGAGKPSDFGWYFGLLRDRYYSVWLPPTVPDSASMTVTLKIKVKRDGTVLGYELQKSSGNSLMDGSVMEAARQVTQIDALPDGLGKEDTVEIPVIFKPE